MLFLVVGHLDEGNAPTVDELTRDAGRSVGRDVASLRTKGWILIRHIDSTLTVIALSPMAVTALSSLRYRQWEQAWRDPTRYAELLEALDAARG